MPRPLTRAQVVQNRAFLVVLARTGNVRLSAREVGVKYGTIQHRRKKHAGFALRWDAAAAIAHAAFHAAGGKTGVGTPAPRVRGLGRVEGKGGLRQAQPERRGRQAAADPLRTAGGEPVIVRTRDGKLQVRAAHRGKLTRAAEQLFLQALSATANVRLSAAAAGASAAAFYRRRRQSIAFAREMRLALQEGYERIQGAAMMAALPESHEDDAWRHNDPPPIPRMSADQAMQLLFLHEKSVCQSWEKPHRRRRRGESDETYRMRLAAMWAAEKAREAETAAVRRALIAEDQAREGPGERRWREEPLPELPALEQVTGWSRADPRKGRHNPDVALFGGWRMREMEAHQAAKRRRGVGG